MKVLNNYVEATFVNYGQWKTTENVDLAGLYMPYMPWWVWLFIVKPGYEKTAKRFEYLYTDNMDKMERALKDCLLLSK